MPRRAIQVFTLDPSDTLTGHLGFSYASFNDKTVKAYIAGRSSRTGCSPAFRGSRRSRQLLQEHRTVHGAHGIHPTSSGAKLLVKVTDDLTLTFIALAGSTPRNGNWYPLDGISRAVLIPRDRSDQAVLTWRAMVAPKQRSVVNGGSGKAEYTSGLGIFTLVHLLQLYQRPPGFSYFASYVQRRAVLHQNSPTQTYQTELDLARAKVRAIQLCHGWRATTPRL